MRRRGGEGKNVYILYTIGEHDIISYEAAHVFVW